MLKITLKAARVNAGMTQTQAAEKVGVIKETILNWENGKTKIKTIQLMALCQLYGVPIDNIILPENSTKCGHTN